MAKDDPVATAGGAHDIPYVALCKVRPLPPYARRPWLSLPYGRAYPAACRPQTKHRRLRVYPLPLVRMDRAHTRGNPA